MNWFDMQLTPHLSLMFVWKLSLIFPQSFWMLSCRLIQSTLGISFLIRSYNETAIVYFWNWVGVALLYFLWSSLNNKFLSRSLKAAPDAKNNLLFRDPLREGVSHICIALGVYMKYWLMDVVWLVTHYYYHLKCYC